MDTFTPEFMIRSYELHYEKRCLYEGKKRVGDIRHSFTKKYWHFSYLEIYLFSLNDSITFDYIISVCGTFRVHKKKPQKPKKIQVSSNILYHIYRMYLEGQAWANSVDPDETPQNVASHQGLHCLPLIQQFIDTASGSKLYLFKF